MNKTVLFLIFLVLTTLYQILIFTMFPVFENFLYRIDEAMIGSCKVPQLDPFEEKILKYIEKPENITCTPSEPLVHSDLNYLYINRHLLRSFGVKQNGKFFCIYQAFEREIPDENEPDNGIIDVGSSKYFFSKIKVEDEFVKVTCKYNGNKIYYDMFSFVPKKANKNRNKTNTNQKLNVLILGIDSLSQMNFQRQMPRTKKYIEENLNAILLSGYNKVGDNTFPNLMAVLAGLSYEEMTKTCWETENTKFDKCRFIWNDYSDAGYLTAFAEDRTDIGLFNYLKTGFQVQPTHYYWRSFDYYAEAEIGKAYCLGPRPIHKVLLEYTKKFTVSLKDERYFGIFWSSTLSHNCLNCPSLTDEDYVEFFDGLKRDNTLNNTVVIFMSDHGIRFGDILETYQGYLEERLPFLYFIFPSWFQELYPRAIQNMKDNSNLLTANFDIYKTLKDLLEVNNLNKMYLMKNEETFMEKRGISLFSFIPENRSCKMAGIPSHYCTCQQRVEVYTYSTAVRKIANYITNYINNLLQNYTDCAQLELKSINSAFLSKVYSKQRYCLKVYKITLKIMPGDAIFEATVECFDKCYEEKLYVISKSISRLNRYGNQSSCISNSSLKKFCYCIK